MCRICRLPSNKGFKINMFDQFLTVYTFTGFLSGFFLYFLKRYCCHQSVHHQEPDSH